MKKLEDVKKEIADLRATNIGTLTKRQVTNLKSKIQFFELMEKYLRENPTEEFVVSEITRIENRINAIHDNFDASRYKDPTEPRKKYENEMGVPHLRTQLKALWFIKN